ncbi:MAG: efflux RND transporter permease subunit [Candidatus Abyssobacteria bacterium SURF_5]|uniref:Efflux RND transporter permease subunit n=1 Tax=Abyssobacteria bacterium (strain SURF_5) TaxID=2093360 RepID=A0A3A4NVH4_ABYX5|nr:MAG: efflux RND transporter permease subunit [Candidatus Abyssubacteria bacterium SURF_5]
MSNEGAHKKSDRPQPSVLSKIVETFIDSNFSLILIIVSLVLGVAALLVTPREEDPQIVVPLADVYVQFPGASAEEVEQLVSTRLEKLLWQIDGVEYVYSMSQDDMAVMTVRFFVGEDREDSLIKLYNKIQQNVDLVPPGVTGWVVKPVEIDDVPIVMLAFYGAEASSHDLRRVAEEVIDRLQAVEDSARTYTVGGMERQIRVHLNPGKLAARNLTPLEVAGALKAANVTLAAGSFAQDNEERLVRGGIFLNSVEDVRELVVGAHEGRPVYLQDVAQISDGAAQPDFYTRIGFGPAAKFKNVPEEFRSASTLPAVTLAVAKKRGTNAVWVADEVLQQIESMKGNVIPDDVRVLVTRNYGETANDKVNELVEGLAVAIIIVIALIGLMLGWREALIIATAVPISFFLTLFFNMLFGYTINRVTLFALMVSLGLVVDDPITDVENIYRYFKMRLYPPKESVLVAVNEVRPPIIMSTLTIIVSFLPMSFITGMMGPYMRPMALNVPLAVLMSTVVAFTITPWMSYYVLRGDYGKVEEEPFDIKKSRLYAVYSRLIGPFLRSRALSWMFLGAVLLLFLVSASLAAFGLVPLKMLPFDNKNELQLVLDLPEGTTLEETDRAVRDFEQYLRGVAEVTDFESYVGLASPMDFNGMVRHYYLRRSPNLADLRINLVHKKKRQQQSHDIGLRLRDDLQKIADRHGALMKIVEVPPGPPVISTLVGELYAEPWHSYEDIIAAASIVRERMAQEAGVVDVDDTVEADQRLYTFVLDKEKASLNGISTVHVAQTLRLALQGEEAGTLHVPTERNPLRIILRLTRADRSSTESLSRLYVKGTHGNLVQLSELGRFIENEISKTIYHKNLERVSYVFGEMAGRSPTEAIFNLQSHFKKNPLPEGLRIVWSGEGEWKITIQVFRDLGIAFGAALIGIYILLVLQTNSFFMPLIIMTAIPLTIIGIMPGFWLLNALAGGQVGGYGTPIFFTATAMIGMIALAGIVVRNSIILIDFVQNSVAAGMPLREALMESGAVRFRPILLTAGTTLLGNIVITLDPIFSGLAWAIIFGIFASTAFTLLVIPIVYNLVYSRRTIRQKE